MIVIACGADELPTLYHTVVVVGLMLIIIELVVIKGGSVLGFDDRLCGGSGGMRHLAKSRELKAPKQW
jgi:hypothetical protein